MNGFYVEGLASYGGPESCVHAREGAGGAQPRRCSRANKAKTARESTSPMVEPVACACARSFAATSSGTFTVMATLGAEIATGRFNAWDSRK